MNLDWFLEPPAKGELRRVVDSDNATSTILYYTEVSANLVVCQDSQYTRRRLHLGEWRLRDFGVSLSPARATTQRPFDIG